MKRNCDNCAHLKWESGDIHDSEGFVCMKRDYFRHTNFWQAEKEHQERLNFERYRSLSKKCHEPKPQPTGGGE